jgi:hypothetical protein
MRSIELRVSAALLLSTLPLASAQPPDFSGVWEMDRKRSASALQGVPIGPVTLVIDQKPDRVTIETRRKDNPKSAATTETLTFRLDGAETSTAGNSGQVKTRARWEGAKLVTETVRNIQDSTVTTLHSYSLDPHGKELIIDKTLTVQHGYQFPGAQNTGTGRDIFIRRK